MITQRTKPANTRRYESIYDVVHMEDPFVLETEEGRIEVDYKTKGWDAGIYIMFPVDETIKPFLMTAENFRGKYRLQKSHFIT